MHGQHYPAFEASSPPPLPPITVRVPECFPLRKLGSWIRLVHSFLLQMYSILFFHTCSFYKFQSFSTLTLVLKVYPDSPSPTTKNIAYVWTFRSLQIFTRYWRLTHQIPYLTREPANLPIIWSVQCVYNSHTCPVPKLNMQNGARFENENWF